MLLGIKTTWTKLQIIPHELKQQLFYAIFKYTHLATQAIKELKVEIGNIVLSLKKGQAIRITVIINYETHDEIFMLSMDLRFNFY